MYLVDRNITIKFTNAEKALNRIFTKTVGLEYEEPFNKPSIATIE